MKKVWKIKEEISQDLRQNFPEIDPLLLQLLINRGLKDKKEIESFLNPDYATGLHDPFLFKDMQKCVDRIFLAIEKKEKITIHGDYDCDGVCASALMKNILDDLGAISDVYLPHREKEGYGLNVNTINYLIESQTKLIITVDCGTTNYESVELAQANGIDVIITDHHHVPDDPAPAFALINPMNQQDTYPFGYLCGTGVAFKVAQALLVEDLKSAKSKLATGYDKWLLDLVAVATIGDMMQLVDENRVLVKYGMVVLKKTRRKGLKGMMERAGIWNYTENEFTSRDIAFGVVPRINAAGRMDHANAAYQLIMAQDEKEITRLVENLEQSNTDRKNITEKLTKEILEKFPVQEGEYVLVAYGEGWPIGLAGLVASKVMQAVGKPVIIMTKLADRIAGSGRSLPGFDMAVMLEKMQKYFNTSGGHAYACGFSLKPEVDPQEVIVEFKKYAKEALDGRDLRPELDIDAVLLPPQINWEIMDELEKMKPFGDYNPEPLFLSKDFTVVELRKLGNEGQHLKVKLCGQDSNKEFSAIGFSLAGEVPDLKVNDKIDLVYKLDVNEWNGNRELQLKIIDLKKITDN